MFTKMKDIKTLIRKYKMKTKENSDWRSIERLALLVSIIKKTEESGIALSSYNDAAFSRSDTEVKLAHEIISNSIFSDVLVKVNSCAVCENEEFILF